MAVLIKHNFVSPIVDEQAPGEVGPDEWNDDHTITGLDKDAVGLGSVDNTSDADKPVSTAQQTALDLKANIADLATVATTGDYNDLINTPSIPTGDMTKAVYDPNSIEDDAFDQDNMADGTTNKNYTATEKTKLAGVETAADVTDAANVAAAGAFMKASDDSDDITEGASKLLMTASERSAIAALSATYQPLDSDLTSWGGVARASGYDAFAATPSSANLRSLVIDETGSGALVFATAPTLSDPVVGTQSAGDNSTKAASTAYVDTGLALKISSSLLTTRGDVITRGASAPQRLALGAAKTVLRSDGTDALFAQLAMADISDYVPGSTSWTPAITINNSATGITYSQQSGSYIKIGSFVLAFFDIRLSNKGASTGVVNITGLPVTVGSVNGGGGISQSFNVASFSGPMVVPAATTSTARLQTNGATGSADATNENLTNTTVLVGFLLYLV